MKPFLAVLVLFTVLASSAQITPGNDSMDAQIRKRLATRPEQSPLTLPPAKPNEVTRNGITYSGILVQFAKTDKPLELINPAAPPEYGSSEDNLAPDPQTGRQGLKLFSIRF